MKTCGKTVKSEEKYKMEKTTDVKLQGVGVGWGIGVGSDTPGVTRKSQELSRKTENYWV